MMTSLYDKKFGIRQGMIPMLMLLFLILFASCSRRGDEPRGREIITLELLVDRTEAKANGSDALIFRVKSSNQQAAEQAEIYFTHPSSPVHRPILAHRRFVTELPGRYTFYAIYGKEAKSESIEVEFAPSVLSLWADRVALKANGVDGITFIARRDGRLLSEGYQILFSSDKGKHYQSLEGNTFVPSAPGEYLFVVRERGQQSEPLSIVAQQVALELKADRSETIANGSNQVAFTLTEDGRPTQEYQLLYRLGEGEFRPLTEHRYTFSEAGFYSFKATKGIYTSNIVAVKAAPSILSLTSDRDEIEAESGEAKLSVSQDGVPLEGGYEIRVRAAGSTTSTPLSGTTFRERTAGVYHLLAEKGKLRSPEVRITVTAKPAEPITPPESDAAPILQPSKLSLTADGKDEVTFTITLDGRDVTPLYDVYREEMLNSFIRLSRKSFTSTRAGEYSFYAEEREPSVEGALPKRTERVKITVTPRTDDPANGSVFVRNVTLSSGWYDVNKFFGDRNDGKGGDGVMCWAASASNMIEWWLDDYERKGYKLPADMPRGRGRHYENKSFEVFLEHWRNYLGIASIGVQFFLVEPDMRNQNTKDYLLPESKHFKGYFKRSAQWSEVEWFFAGYYGPNPYVKDYGSYSNWISNRKGLRGFTDLIVRLLNEGAVSLTVGNHEVTVWGVDLKDGLADYIYITNSDDQFRNLHKIKLEGRDNNVYLAELIKGASGSIQDGGGKRIVGLTGFKAYPAKK